MEQAVVRMADEVVSGVPIAGVPSFDQTGGVSEQRRHAGSRVLDLAAACAIERADRSRVA
jgi:hypothetical protein